MSKSQNQIPAKIRSCQDIQNEIEVLKSIKARDRTPEQKKELKALYQRRLREMETVDAKKARNEKKRVDTQEKKKWKTWRWGRQEGRRTE